MSTVIELQRDRILELELVVRNLTGRVAELVGAMRAYEMDVDDDAPLEHRQMMERAERTLKTAKRLLDGTSRAKAREEPNQTTDRLTF